MGTSIRCIRVIDDTYTIEIETEVEDSGELFTELTKTLWGRKLAYLLQEMLPEVPEFTPLIAKEEAEAEAQRISEHEEELRKEGYDKAFNEYGKKTKEEIQKEAKKEVRERYLDYIRKKQGRPKKRPPCFETYIQRTDECRTESEGYHAMVQMAQYARECNACKYKAECVRRSQEKKKESTEPESPLKNAQ